jgi:hypothetical protein
MIYVRRNVALIPKKVLEVAARAQTKLNELKKPADRRAFIKKKSHIWRAFGRYLADMSYGKCWYSESPDPQSFFDVDHYRPKLEARRSDTEVDKPGYEWLAFSWENFRYAANCSNRIRENIETGVVEGKGSWFPLLEGSVKASWTKRCEAEEGAVLLDPIKQSDVDLVEVKADGKIGASRLAVGNAKRRVEQSCKLYGLNLPGIKGARLRLMREVQGMVEVLADTLVAASDPEMAATIADRLPVGKQRDLIKLKTLPRSPYSKAARAALIDAGWAELCAKPEECDDLMAA